MSDPINRELLDHWRAEDQLIFVSNADPGVCVACGTRGLVKTYRTKVWAQGLCSRCFGRRGQGRDGLVFRLICLAFVVNVAMVLGATAVMAKFDPMSFFEKHTTFFSDFKAFRAQWFAVEDRISGIKDEYEPVDWAAIRDSAKEVVVKHERLMVKFARDCRSARSKLPPAEAAQARNAIEIVLEYLDSVGLVVLKLL